MEVWIIVAEAVFDAGGALFDRGGIVSVFSTEAKARQALAGIEDNYTRKRNDYSIERYQVR